MLASVASLVLLFSCIAPCVAHPGTVAEGAPIIPISAQLKYNVEVVCEYVVNKIPVPLRDFSSEPRLIGAFIIVVVVCSRVSFTFNVHMYVRLSFKYVISTPHV